MEGSRGWVEGAHAGWATRSMWLGTTLFGRRAVVAVQLHVGDLAVVAALGHQLRVRAALGDLPVLQHQHPVRPLHAADPVGDDEHRPFGHHRVHAPADQILGFGVNRGRRVVQHQHARVVQNGPRDRQPLPLPAAQAAAALADHRAVLVGQLVDELVRLRQPRRGLDHPLGHVRPAVGNVRRDRVAEQIRLLEDEPHRPPHLVKLQVAQVHAVEQDPPPAAGRRSG